MRIVLTVIFVLVSIALSVIVLAQQGADGRKACAGYKNSCRCICCTGSGTEFEFLGDGGSMQQSTGPFSFLYRFRQNEGEKDWILIIRQKKKNSWSAVKR